MGDEKSSVQQLNEDQYIQDNFESDEYEDDIHVEDPSSDQIED